MLKSFEKYHRIYGTNWVTGRKLLPLLEQVGNGTAGVVLDAGCGDSPFERYFKNADKYLKMDCKPRNSNTIVTVLPEIPLPDKSVDTILMFHVITDIADLSELFQELHRILKPKGKIYILESLCYPEHDLPDDYYRLLPNGLRYYSDKSGFHLRKVEYLGGLFTRVAVTWNTFFMGKIGSLPLFGCFSKIGIIFCNLICWISDKVFYHPRLAESYFAEVEKPQE